MTCAALAHVDGRVPGRGAGSMLGAKVNPLIKSNGDFPNQPHLYGNVCVCGGGGQAAEEKPELDFCETLVSL